MANPDRASGQSLASLGEFGLIAALATRFPSAPTAIVGIGDDSAVLATPDGNVVAAVDFLIEGRHFLRAWSSGYDAGVKAAARSLADIAAMGAVPTALLVALAVPESLPADWALDLASGIAAECTRAGAGVAGGDTAKADAVIVSVTALGSLPAGSTAVCRSGRGPATSWPSRDRSAARPRDSRCSGPAWRTTPRPSLRTVSLSRLTCARRRRTTRGWKRPALALRP